MKSISLEGFLPHHSPDISSVRSLNILSEEKQCACWTDVALRHSPTVHHSQPPLPLKTSSVDILDLTPSRQVFQVVVEAGEEQAMEDSAQGLGIQVSVSKPEKHPTGTSGLPTARLATPPNFCLRGMLLLIGPLTVNTIEQEIMRASGISFCLGFPYFLIFFSSCNPKHCF